MHLAKNERKKIVLLHTYLVRTPAIFVNKTELKNGPENCQFEFSNSFKKKLAVSENI